MTNKKVLVTGIDGFTGHYVCQELIAAGYNVYGIGKKTIKGVVEIFDVDITDYYALSEIVKAVKPDLVVNLAAIAFVNHGNVEDIYKVNLVGCRNLLQALCENDVRPSKVLLVSSANIYGNSDAGILDENIVPSPQNDYAISKYSMELMARLWFDKLPIVITRPFNYTGIGQDEKFLVPKIVSHFTQKKKVIELGNIDVYRDFSDVRFVAATYLQLLESDKSSIVVNICSGNDCSLRYIIEVVSRLAGYEIEVLVNPDFVRSNEIYKLTGDVKKLRTITTTNSIPIEDTLKWMFDSDQFR
tara:strand:- start:303 stop:1202 length:900 start_codon:yes stop_codon:yes gene_type:complete